MATGRKITKAPVKTLTSKRDIVGIHVKFTLNTPDGLRRVIFELKKDSDGDTEKWSIDFQLFERAKKTDPFGDPLVDLAVDVSAKLNPKAEAMADDGMTKKQARHAVGKAADTAKDPKADQATKQAVIQDTLKQ